MHARNLLISELIVCDRHSRETLFAAVRAWLRMTTKTCNKGQVKVKLFYEPIDISAAVATKDFRKLRLLCTPLQGI